MNVQGERRAYTLDERHHTATGIAPAITGTVRHVGAERARHDAQHGRQQRRRAPCRGASLRSPPYGVKRMTGKFLDIFGPDRGSQYCSKRYRKLLSNNALRCSMGRRATCYGNAVTESFFHSLKVELVHRERYTTRRMAQTRIFEYIEIFNN
jgi:hypothetical protein